MTETKELDCGCIIVVDEDGKWVEDVMCCIRHWVV